MREVLILGNGVSRLDHMKFINNFEGEIWGCNSVYKEVANGMIKRLDAMTGDRVALKEAIRVKEQNNFTYKIWSRGSLTHTLQGTQLIGIEPKYIYDSGTTLVCKALLEKYDKIYLVGFDLGGADLYVKGHETRNKSSWIVRWRKIASEFSLDNIEFLGYNHKEFILSNKPIDTYAKVYLRGHNHLDVDYESTISASNDVLILGNGKSRATLHEFISSWSKELWVCNEAYEETKTKGYSVTRVCSVHNEMICEAYDHKLKYGTDYQLWSRWPVEGLEGKHHRFREQRGWCTGALSVCQAILEDFEKIYLAGFDFGGPDLYKDYDVTGSNFKKQFIEVKRIYPSFKSKVEFMGIKPEFLYRGG